MTPKNVRFFSPLLLFLTLITIVATSCSPHSSQSQPTVEGHIPFLAKDESIIHPILKVKGGHGLDGKKLSTTVFKQLNNFRDSSFKPLQSLQFITAETEAATQFCQNVKGKSKNIVEEFGGRPVFRGGTVGCWNADQPSDDIWLYTLGAREIPIKLVFRNDVCVDALLCSASDFVSYQDWRAALIEKLAVGEKMLAIVNKEARPSHIQDMNGQEVAIDSKISPLALTYVIGPSRAVRLVFNKGLCTEAETFIIAR